MNAYLIDAISNAYLRNAINTNQLNQSLLNLEDYIVFILFQVYSTMYFILFGIAPLVLQSKSDWINDILQRV